MRVKKLENFKNKIGIKGCKWSRLNAPATWSPQSHSILELLVVRGNENVFTKIKMKCLNYFNQYGLKILFNLSVQMTLAPRPVPRELIGSK